MAAASSSSSAPLRGKITVTEVERKEDEETTDDGYGHTLVATKDIATGPSVKLRVLIKLYLAEVGDTQRHSMDFKAWTLDTNSSGGMRELKAYATLVNNGLRDGDQIFITHEKSWPVFRAFKRVEEFRKTHHLAWILMVFVVVTLCFFIGRAIYLMPRTGDIEPVPDVGSNFGIVIDAGSVHSSVSVYQWPADEPFRLKEVFQCEFEDSRGVTSFIEEPSKVQDYIRNSICLRQAVAASRFARINRMYLGCTGGMRSVNRTNPIAAQQLIGNITAALRNTGVILGKVEVLNGLDEGIYGWVTVNVKSPSVEAGTLDWGGASSQITFPVREDSPLNTEDADHVKTVKVFSLVNKLYTNSQLCYGQSSALKRYFVQLMHEVYVNTNSTLVDLTYASPCHPREMASYQVKGGWLKSTCTLLTDEKFNEALEQAANKTFTFVGTGDQARCRAMIQDQFDAAKCKSVYQQHRTCFNFSTVATPPQGLKYFAFSTYFYLVQVLKQAPEVDSVSLKISNLEEILTKVCVKSSQTLLNLEAVWGSEKAHNSCFRAVFMKQLLTGGYGFTNWTNIDFVSKVGGTSVGWQMGYLLSRLGTDYDPDNDDSDADVGYDPDSHHHHRHYASTWLQIMLLLVLFLGLFLLMGLALSCPYALSKLGKACTCLHDRVRRACTRHRDRSAYSQI